MTGLDLACRTVGGSVVAASDESFGIKERLIDAAEPDFVPGTFDLRGEVVDGWETRRHAPAPDWVIIRLGVPGRLHTVDVDTRFFTGNHPTGCTLYAATLAAGTDSCDPRVDWRLLSPLTALKADAHNPIAVDDPRRYTHLKLVIASDGGVARLRAYGDPVPDPVLWSGVTVEVSGAEQGVASSTAATRSTPTPGRSSPRTGRRTWDQAGKRGAGVTSGPTPTMR
ncbi:hypothetical protein ACQ856_20280 [Mycolicibacterium psychrotolerans]|uniref:hypothetical protein n=1 Tax=Mycolicibacterium psychrotolerans TaxID=216929 RepID=UPI003D67D7FE